jgi:hypothetical protein
MSTTKEELKSELFKKIDWIEHKLNRFDEDDILDVIAYRKIKTKIGDTYILLCLTNYADDISIDNQYDLVIGNKKINEYCKKKHELKSGISWFENDGNPLFKINIGKELEYNGFKYNQIKFEDSKKVDK